MITEYHFDAEVRLVWQKTKARKTRELARMTADVYSSVERKRSAGRVGRLNYVFVVGFLSFRTLYQKFTGMSSEVHQKFTEISPEIHQNSPECHQNFAVTSSWSTLKKGITTTQPSHTGRLRAKAELQYV